MGNAKGRLVEALVLEARRLGEDAAAEAYERAREEVVRRCGHPDEEEIDRFYVDAIETLRAAPEDLLTPSLLEAAVSIVRNEWAAALSRAASRMASKAREESDHAE